MSPLTHVPILQSLSCHGVCSCLVLAIPQVSLEEQKAPGALEGPGHCACEQDGHGHVAQGHRGTLVHRTMSPSGCRCSCSSDPQRQSTEHCPAPWLFAPGLQKTRNRISFPSCLAILQGSSPPQTSTLKFPAPVLAL